MLCVADCDELRNDLCVPIDKNLVMFGLHVRALREKQGLSQEALAARAELHENQIGFIESGKRDMKMTTLIRLANGLDMHPSEVLKGAPFARPPYDQSRGDQSL